MLRNFLLSTVLGAATLYYYLYFSSTTTHPNQVNMSTRSTWSSPFSSWHERALLTPHPDPNSFTPTRDSLLLAVLLNAPVEPEGITLTLFSQPGSEGSDPSTSETIAIDALGRVLIVNPTDASGILSLSHETPTLPQTGRFRNTWVIKQDRTSQPIHRLLVPVTSDSSPSSSNLYEVSVQGFSKEKTELKTPVDGITKLPDVLWELFGLVLEAREDAGTGGDGRRDEAVLEKVRAVVGDQF